MGLDAVDLFPRPFFGIALLPLRERVARSVLSLGECRLATLSDRELPYLFFTLS